MNKDYKISKKPTSEENYKSWLGEMKLRIQSARVSAAKSINRELICLYWDIGAQIVQKQDALGWGRSVVERLSLDLQSEFSGIRGFSSSNL